MTSDLERERHVKEFQQIIKAVVNNQIFGIHTLNMDVTSNWYVDSKNAAILVNPNGKVYITLELMESILRGIIIDLYYAGYGPFIQNALIHDPKKITRNFRLEDYYLLLQTQTTDVQANLLRELIRRFGTIDPKPLDWVDGS